MTTTETLIAGPELDAEVAKAIGCVGVGVPGGTWWYLGKTTWDHLPPFSTDIAAAWHVVEKMRDLWTEATNGVHGSDNSFERPFDDGAFFDVLHRNADRRWPWAFLYVTPEAICRAALAALEVHD